MRDPLLDLPVAEIVERIRANDQQLFEALFTAYWSPLYRVAFAMLHDQSIAEEIVTSVLVSVWERRATWDVHDRIDRWLGNAVRNQVRLRWRNKERHQRLLDTYVPPGESPALGSLSEGTGDLADENRLLELDVAIQSLPQRHQAIVRYRWYEQRSYAEIATLMGISQGTARNLVSQALAILRASLREHSED